MAAARARIERLNPTVLVFRHVSHHEQWAAGRARAAAGCRQPPEARWTCSALHLRRGAWGSHTQQFMQRLALPVTPCATVTVFDARRAGPYLRVGLPGAATEDAAGQAQRVSVTLRAGRLSVTLDCPLAATTCT